MKEKEKNQLEQEHHHSEYHHSEHHHSEHHSEHHHSDHHHHSGHHHSGKKRKKESHRMRKLRYFFKKHKRSLIINGIVILSSLVILTGLLIATGYIQAPDGAASKQNAAGSVLANAIRMELSYFAQEQDLLGEAASTYLSSDLQQSVTEAIAQYWSEDKRLDESVPITFRYDVTGIPENCALEKAVLEVSLEPTFENARVFEMDTAKKQVAVYNLYAGAQYYYRVTLHISGGSQVAAQSTFRTSAGPRLLCVDGVRNIRDIGSWKTEDGKTIRQGLLYRGRELDGAEEPQYLITSAGLDTMLKDLGIKTEMDLRGNILQASLGETVTFLRYPAAMYDDFFKENHKEEARQIFSDLADPQNYPIYMHCTYGMDRTGTVCLLLEALLGLSEEVLIREYELSALCYGGVNDQRLDALMVALKKQSGDTLQQKAENFLLSAGVTQAEIDSIREIYLED